LGNTCDTHSFSSPETPVNRPLSSIFHQHDIPSVEAPKSPQTPPRASSKDHFGYTATTNSTPSIFNSNLNSTLALRNATSSPAVSTTSSATLTSSNYYPYEEQRCIVAEDGDIVLHVHPQTS